MTARYLLAAFVLGAYLALFGVVVARIFGSAS